MSQLTDNEVQKRDRIAYNTRTNQLLWFDERNRFGNLYRKGKYVGKISYCIIGITAINKLLKY
jgi:hypothetical protein